MENVSLHCHLLSFEGPDAYSSAGGLSSRITGICNSLVGAGFKTHLWFVGDPDLPGHEERKSLELHRWCQWISRHHSNGVYDGEEGKRSDYSRSLPPYIYSKLLRPHLQRGGSALVMAEEWHTVDAVLHLDWLLRQHGCREQVTILWNANNIFGFERIDWQRLTQAAIITTVSRYMKGLLLRFDIDPVVIPNGLSKEAFFLPQEEAVRAFHERLCGRFVLSKVARWDPAKSWLPAIQMIRTLKERGWRPLLVARGGVEGYGEDVFNKAKAEGLELTTRAICTSDERGLLEALGGMEKTDIVNLVSPLRPVTRKLLFHASDAVLANSRHEPFGLVGLETMAARGLACVGNTGEDYAIAGYNALVLESSDAQEFINLFARLKASPVRADAIRRAGRRTAQEYTWGKIIERVLLPRLNLTQERKPM